ncbi:UNVERIFIED_CONTAM: hypothetical protein GTU68_049225 [Idotea baltica]|nr:hypothetical protein [Idotea baltica]
MGLAWSGIAEAIGMSPVWTHSAAVGMNAMPADKAEALVSLLGLPEEGGCGAHGEPDKDLGADRSHGPLHYRLYEIVGVYGATIRR